MQKISFVDRWFPHPLVSVLCGLSWIMLAQSLEAATLVMALLLAFIIPKLLSPFIDRTPNINWMEALKLFFVVVWDIILCNINVANIPKKSNRLEKQNLKILKALKKLKKF